MTTIIKTIKGNNADTLKKQFDDLIAEHGAYTSIHQVPYEADSLYDSNFVTQADRAYVITWEKP